MSPGGNTPGEGTADCVRATVQVGKVEGKRIGRDCQGPLLVRMLKRPEGRAPAGSVKAGCGLPVGETAAASRRYRDRRRGAAGTLRRRGRRRYSGAAFAGAKTLKA